MWALVVCGCASQPPEVWYDGVDTVVPQLSEPGIAIDGFREYLNGLGPQRLRPPIQREIAYRILAITPEFSGTAIGIAPAPSLQSHCINALLYEPDSAEVFEALRHRGTLAGQLYALCGLYLCDRQHFNALVPRYRAMDATVTAFTGGCVGDATSVRDIVADIESGYWPRAFVWAYRDGRKRGLFTDTEDVPDGEPLPSSDEASSSD
ncbi:MAG: hypothetical protein WD042_19805 [Phycisphaeraceae bacterium]